MKTTENKTQAAKQLFTVGKDVIIRKVSDIQKKEMKIEDYYYIKKFENKVGKISELQQSTSGICTYRVDFGENDFGYFYSKDLKAIMNKVKTIKNQ